MCSYKQKCNKVLRTLALGIILALISTAFLAIPTYAATETIEIYTDNEADAGDSIDDEVTAEAEIGDWIKIIGHSFSAGEAVNIYLSSNEADTGDRIGGEVTAYEHVMTAYTNADDDFDTYFSVPTQLIDGKHQEDVHGGDYYVYAAYSSSGTIVAVVELTITDGEIELDSDEGHVGTEVEISGEGLRGSQEITIKYDGDNINIASGDERTDSTGNFTCTIIIPESTTDNHTITVIDESGNRPEVDFCVEPKITVDPTSVPTGETVKVSGTGFAEREDIAITFDGGKAFTPPISIYTNRRGSFEGSFPTPSYADGDTIKIEALDESFNTAEAQLTILANPATQAGISLIPITSPTSPGHVGMEVTVSGTNFIARSTITITYGNGKAITSVTIPTDGDGNFSATFAIPPSVAGSHTVTATDGTNTTTSIFTMESEAPPIPAPLLPKVATTAGVHFDWNDVEDISGRTYTIQVASDTDFSTIAFERQGIANSEYTLTTQERLNLTERTPPYYWRVKAVDRASNESEWTLPAIFYVGFSWTSLPNWTLYIWIGVGILILASLGFWVWRRSTYR